uniref:Coiled-coil protein 142 C-terminal domain-containing protein n=1 Tax=Pavo cristatus TaxID=9049 RepID=A0A8C9FYM3_PAVCR
MARVPPPPRGLLPALPGSGTEPTEPGERPALPVPHRTPRPPRASLRPHVPLRTPRSAAALRPADGPAPRPAGGASLGGLARSLQRAEAMLRSCVSPGILRLRGPRTGGSSASDSEEEDAEGGPRAALVEQSFQGLRRAFRAWENPRTETFHGHVLPPPADAFCYHAVHPRVAERCAALHALLQHRHQLRLARHYSRRLKAASDFVRRLLSPEPRPLRALCEELRTHSGHWAALRRRMRGDAWLRPLLLRRHEAVAHMRRALGLLALQAARLLEERLEAALRCAARDGTPPALLADLFQGLEIYNRVLGELGPEPGSAAGRVLALLAAERGRRAAESLARLLRHGYGGSVAEEEEDAGCRPAGRGAPSAPRGSCSGRSVPVRAGGAARLPPRDAGTTREPSGPRDVPQRCPSAARIPAECEEELGRLCRRLQCRDFALALGSGLSDRCTVPERSEGAAHSGTARLLQRLYPALSGPPGSPCLRLQLLGCCLATAQASCSWLMGKAFQYLAAWSLQQFLLLLKAETDALELLVNAAFPEPEDSPQHLAPHRRLRFHHERWLCLQIRSAAASIQLFAGDVLKLFSTDCKRMSAEIFDQTMPLGRHWRLGLRAELPSSPSEYAAAAAQTVLGQVLQGAQLLPRDSQVPTLARVMTAFVEAWMDHILAQKIKFRSAGRR